MACDAILKWSTTSTVALEQSQYFRGGCTITFKASQMNIFIEKSQYFQGGIRAGPSKVGAVSFVSDLRSDGFVAKVFICFAF